LSRVYFRNRNTRGPRNGPFGQRQIAFTLIELSLVIVVISVIGIVAADRLHYYQELAEKVAIDATLASVNMGLRIQLAVLTASNRRNIASSLEHENPLRWLEQLPSNYGGEYQPSPRSGNWYFAKDTSELVYVPRNASYLRWEQPAAAAGELRFAARVRYDEMEATAGTLKVPSGISIVTLTAYRWF
jgi:type II secretory pathway pseudopilin PulG